MFKKLIVAITLIASSAAANAALINFSFTPSSSNVFNINLNTPTGTFSDAIFTLNVAGDFNSSFEFLTYNVEGLFTGQVLDSNTGNDAFDFGSNDNPISSNAPSPIVSSFATIPQAVWAQIIADGVITLAFTTTADVNCCSGPDVNPLSGSFDFESTSVPSPSVFSILLLGVAALVARKRLSK